MNFKWKQFAYLMRTGGNNIFFNAAVAMVVTTMLLFFMFFISFFGVNVLLNEGTWLSTVSFIFILIFNLGMFFVFSAIWAGITGSYYHLLKGETKGTFLKSVKKYTVRVFGSTCIYLLFVALMGGLWWITLGGDIFNNQMEDLSGQYILGTVIFSFMVSFISYVVLLPLLTFSVYEGNRFKHLGLFLRKHGLVYLAVLGIYVIAGFIPLLGMLTSFFSLLFPLYIMVLYQEEKNSLSVEDVEKKGY